MVHDKSVSVIIPCLILPHKENILLDITRLCLYTLRSHTERDIELILIDNASPVCGDRLAEWADIYIKNTKNLGFAPAVNQGLKIARGEWLVVSNNDITFIHDWIGNALDVWTPDTGIISSHLHGNDKEHKRNRIEVPWGHMMGALWMTHRSVVEKVGLLDERFERGMFRGRRLFCQN